MKLCLAARQQNNLNPALLPLGQRGAFHLRLPPVACGVLHLQRPIAAQLDAIRQDRARRQGVGSEAGAGIIHLQQLNRPAGAVFHGCINVVGVAARPSHQRNRKNHTPESLGAPSLARTRSCAKGGRPRTPSRPKNPGLNLHFGLPSASAAPSAASRVASFFSTRSSRLANSGSLWKRLTARSHKRLSKPGDPEMTFPAGTSCETADCAVRITPSPTVQWPATPV